MRKISITKKDLVPRIVEKILESEDNEIVLLVPRDSEIKKSPFNFELIRREAEVAGKTVSISSLDAEIIELANKAGIVAGSRSEENNVDSNLMSDIIPLKRAKEDKWETAKNRVPKPPNDSAKLTTKETTKKETARKEDEEIEAELKLGKTFWDKAEKESEAKRQFVNKIDELPPQEEPAKKTRRHFGKKGKIVSAAALLLLILGTGWIVGALWGKAEISLSFKKTPWQYSGKITASKTISQIDVSKGYLPAEVFSQPKNVTRIFPASGVAQVSQKAAAKILIYNAYSSSNQKFVATTRFATPDGKIFRLDNAVVVPGAGIKNGKIVPSSIEVSVTADKAGAEYNIGPFDKLSIPGFKGTPRYEGFYGVMTRQASGGFVGNKKVATDQDISSGKNKTSQGLKDALQGTFLNSLSPGFNILDGASSTGITKLVANKNTDAEGNFSVFGEAMFKAIGFRDEDVKSLVKTLMLKDNPDMDFADLKLDYQNVKPDFVSGQLTFSLIVDGVIKPQFSADALKSKIAGKPLGEARSTIIVLPDLTSAKISLWPFWLNRLPKDAGKINVVWN